MLRTRQTAEGGASKPEKLTEKLSKEEWEKNFYISIKK